MNLELFSPAESGHMHAPITPWRTPDGFPDLSSAKMIAFDCETYDPDIENGPGFVKHNGAYVVGVAIGTDDGYRGYFPMRHTMGGNLNPEAVVKWLRKTLSTNQPKIGHNVLYDLEALSSDNISVNGRLHDTMLAEPLLDEQKRSYSLDATARAYLGDSKVDAALYKWLATVYGGNPDRKQAGNIYRAPVSLVGPYAEADVDLPLRIWEEQKPLLEAQELMGVYDLECSLLPMLLQMRKTGVRVDVPRAELLRAELKKRILQQDGNIRKLVGFGVDVWAAESVKRAFEKLSIPYGCTVKGAPSFTTEFFNKCKEPLAQHILELRKTEKFLGTFVEGYILGNQNKGKIHCQFHQLRSDDGGTVTGRMSSSNPCLQNLPAHDEELGPWVRSLFIPEEGHDWVSADYSQIEPRILLHYAKGQVAEDMRAAYTDDATTDFYNYIVHLTGVTRRHSKAITLGSMYGLGKQGLADRLGLPLENANALYDKFHASLPFISDMTALTAQVATDRGYIKTLLGRRARFDLWESKDWKESKGAAPLPKEQAQEKWGSIRRAGMHKTLNRLIQGSAADVYKMGLSKCYNAGVFDVLPLHLLVHDENDVSVPRTAEGQAALKEMVHLMETAVPLKLPLLVKYDSGANWAECK